MTATWDNSSDFPIRRAVVASIAMLGPASGIATVEAAPQRGAVRGHTVTTLDGRRFFVRHLPGGPSDYFLREADGLREIAERRMIRVPRVLHAAAHDGTPFVLMEHMPSGAPRPDYAELLGRRLGLMHQTSRRPRFGFDRHTYLLVTRQDNSWTPDWVRFFRSHRLEAQLRIARDKGLIDEALTRIGRRLLEDLIDLLGEPNEPAVLCHGHLFSHALHVDAAGQPVLVEPAAYYGRREADLATTSLFQPFGERFFAAYNEVWPLQPGWPVRFELYQLYHLLNLMNTYGPRYYPACVTIIQRYQS